MSYRVKEIFRTLQGEGARTGRAAVFCRFSGCNLWSGAEHTRDASPCVFCDTDFVGVDGPGGGVFETASELAAAIQNQLPAYSHPAYRPYVVLTGGEPALQLDEELLRALQAHGFETAVESNGTLPLPRGLDWITISPKSGTTLRVAAGDELKLVWPQDGIDLEFLETLPFRNFYLQPRSGAGSQALQECIRLCLTRPLWRLSLQTHKLIGIP